jgi:excisionase family DNA binding protein
MENIMTAKELGECLKLAEATIYKLASRGELPGFKIGDSWRFDVNTILKMIRGVRKGTRNRKESGFFPPDVSRKSYSP